MVSQVERNLPARQNSDINRSSAPAPLLARAPAAAMRRASPRPAPHDAATPIACRLAVLERLHAIHPDIGHSCGQLLRTLVRRMVLDRRRIEHHYVGKITLLQLTAIGQ